MKKIISMFLLVSLLFVTLISCQGNQNDPQSNAVSLEALKDHDAVANLMLTGDIDVAILPEPKATAAINAAKAQGFNYTIAFNLSTEWDDISEYALAMGCLAVNNESLNAKASEIDAFLNEYEQSILFINNQTNHDAAAEMIVSAGIIPKLPVAKSALTNLYGSIVYQDGEDMKNTLVSFYNAIELPLPSDSFYYTPTESQGSATQKLSIGVMNGPTGMGMAKLINDKANDANYEFISYTDPTIALTDLRNGDIDLACIPTNAAASASNKGIPISVAAINCLGSLYVVVKDGITLTSIEDLKGMTVYYGVPTSTTAPIFKYILTKQKIEVRAVEE